MEDYSYCIFFQYVVESLGLSQFETDRRKATAKTLCSYCIRNFIFSAAVIPVVCGDDDSGYAGNVPLCSYAWLEVFHLEMNKKSRDVLRRPVVYVIGWF